MNALTTLPVTPTRLRCIGRHQETPDCVTLRWVADVPMVFKPGQFISLQVPVAGQTLTRAYTIASSPTQGDYVEITVKRVEGGRVSTVITQDVHPGTVLDALPPAGKFYLNTEQLPDRLVLLSAGCGITPMLSMTRYLLATGSPVPIHFMHSARNRANSIACAELEALAAQYPQLDLHWCWSEQGGRLDVARLPGQIPDLLTAEIFACGPDAYMQQIAATLQHAGVPAARIHLEDFAPQHMAITATENWRVHAAQYQKTAEAKPGQTLLDALESEQLPIIGACRAGVCGSCKCKVTSGTTASSHTDTLSEQDIRDGYVLACSTVVHSDVTVEW